MQLFQSIVQQVTSAGRGERGELDRVGLRATGRAGGQRSGQPQHELDLCSVLRESQNQIVGQTFFARLLIAPKRAPASATTTNPAPSTVGNELTLTFPTYSSHQPEAKYCCKHSGLPACGLALPKVQTLEARSLASCPPSDNLHSRCSASVRIGS